MQAVIYARYSTGHDQTERSIEGQLEDCYKYAEQHNLHVVGEYIDRKISGRSDNRKEFQRMIDDSAHKNFDVVIVWKLDRFARNRYDSAMYKAKLKKNGVQVMSAMEAIPDTPEGVMLEAMIEGMAEYYSLDLALKVRRGMRTAREKGEFMGGTIPYGYRIENKKPVIAEEEAEVIRGVFEAYANGARLKDLADTYNASGLKPRYGKKFTVSSFQNALRNRRYIGEDIADGITYTNIFPPIVSTELFDKVQQRISAVKKAPAASKARVKYQLQGKLFCGMCGHNMIGESGKSHNGEMHYYYTCANRKKNRACKKRNEKKDFIEWYVVEQTMLTVLTKERIEELSKLLEAEYKKEFDASGIAVLEHKIASLDNEIEKNIDLLLENRNNSKFKERITKRIDDLEAQKELLDSDLSSLRRALSASYDSKRFKAWLYVLKKGDPTDPVFRQTIIDTFINSVFLFDNKVVIYFNANTKSEQVSYIDVCTDLEEIDTIDNNTCSDFACFGGGKTTKSELFIKSHSIFAIIVLREQ